MNRMHVISTLVWLSLAIFPTLIYTQNDKMIKRSAAGATFGITDEQTIDLLMPTIEGVGGTARELLQQQSVKAYMMPVRKVGTRGSELSYLLASCMEYYINLDKNYKVNLSPDYISLNIEANGQKASPEEAFTFLSKQGTVNAAIIPYDASTLTEAVYAAPKYKISNYLYLFRDITPARQRVYEVRKALMRGNPVLVNMKADDAIHHLVGRTWQPAGEGTQLYPFVVVSYDESQQAVELMSCWGRNWGSNGYIWMSYDDFGKYAQNGFVLITEGIQ